MESAHLPSTDEKKSLKRTVLKIEILNYQKIMNNMFMLFYILLIYQIANCLLLAIDCQCFLTPQNILIKITANQVTAEFA